MGPTQAAGMVRNGSEGSSSTSSIKELSAVDEKGLNRSFRAIKNSAGLRTEPIKKIEDQNNEGRGTPSSTASSHSGLRVLFSKDGKKTVFSPAAIQLAKTTRDFIKEQRQPVVENHVDVPGPLEESTGPYTTEFKEETKGNGRCWLKCTILGLCLAILIAAMALLIHFNKDSESSGAEPIILPDAEDPECPLVQSVKFREVIVFNCSFKEEARNKLEKASYVEILPPPYYKNGQTIVLSNTKGNSDWIYFLNKGTGSLRILGPISTCSSSGKYAVTFKDETNATIHSVLLTLEVISEVSKVNVNLTQEESQGEKLFRISCSTNSGCQQSFVDFFAEINKEETHIRGVNFSCEINYNDISGYSVSCEGVIPDFLMEQFKKITCRPNSVLLDDAGKVKKLEEKVELPKCDISNNCGYKCKNYSEHYFEVDDQRCDIFHRCYDNEVYSTFCPPGTFFNPVNCACDHSKRMNWCRDDGLNYNSEKGQNETWCDASV